MHVYDGHFQPDIHMWPLDKIVNCLVYLAIVLHEDFHFKSQNRRANAQVIVGQSANYSFSLCDHKGSPICVDYKML